MSKQCDALTVGEVEVEYEYSSADGGMIVWLKGSNDLTFWGNLSIIKFAVGYWLDKDKIRRMLGDPCGD